MALKTGPDLTPEANPIDEIEPRTIEVARLLGPFAQERISGEATESIRGSLPSVNAEVSRELDASRKLFVEQPSHEELQTQGDLWSRRRMQLTA